LEAAAAVEGEEEEEVWDHFQAQLRVVVAEVAEVAAAEVMVWNRC
jgi:hypothetical protein